MKRHVLFVLAFIFSLTLTVPTAIAKDGLDFNKLVVEKDEFTGVITKTVRVKCSEFLVVASNVNSHLRSLIVFKNDSWEYLRCNQVYFLIDGKRLSPKTEYDGSVGTGYVLEFISLYSIEDVKQILMGTKVKFKICNDVFEIPIEKLTLLKQILN